MPPRLASILTWLFIFWLFRRDVRQQPNVSRALWIPFFWLTINMSRPISMWLNMFGIPVSGSLEGGTPVDACFYFGLILGGAYVLRQRYVTVGEVVGQNLWVFAFLGFGLVSLLWSDFPFVTSKRWIKSLGHPIMALIVLTEADPRQALITLLKRCAYILVPLSVLFIKYYPEWGRQFSEWTGQAMNSGVTLGKNALGADCLILSFFFVWYYVQVRQLPPGRQRRDELYLCVCFMALIWWLFKLADSKTPLASLIPGTLVMLFAGFKSVNPRQVGFYVGAVVVFLVVAELSVGVYENTIRMLGRDATLTERTYLWEDLLKFEINPVTGYGFETFWLGDRLQQMWQLHTWRPNQAHNGYIETYMNLGWIGVFILLGGLASAWIKAHRHLVADRQLGRFRLGFVVAVILYNWTEASFKALHPVWTLFYLVALDRPRSLALSSPDPMLPASDAHEADGPRSRREEVVVV